MKRLLPAVLAAFLAATSAQAEGINLSWNDCGLNGTLTSTFACNSNTGSPFSAVASFVPPAGMDLFLGISSQIDIVTSDAILPDWWQHGTGTCRGSTGLSVSFDFTSGPFSCADFFTGQAAGGFAYESGFGSPNRARFRIQCAIPFDNRGPIDENTEYYAYKANFARAKTTGTGSCPGCSTPMCIVLNEIQLFQPPEALFDPQIVNPADRSYVNWQAALIGCPAATATRSATWGRSRVSIGSRGRDSRIGRRVRRIAMGSRTPAAALMALVVSAAPALAEGIDLSWSECGSAGTLGTAFDCGTNEGAHHVLVGSFIPPGVADLHLRSVSAVVQIFTGQSSLPDWWKHGGLACRRREGIVLEAPTAATCSDPYGSVPTMGWSYQLDLPSPGRARLHVQTALTAPSPVALDSTIEYVAFRAAVTHARTTGSASCSGCLEPACLVLEFIDLVFADRPPMSISAPIQRSFVTWQSSFPHCPLDTPVRRSTWGQVRTLYR